VAECTICHKVTRTVRDEIDQKLIEGATITSIAAEYFPDKPPKTSHAIIARHRDNGHIMQKAQEYGLMQATETVLNVTNLVHRIVERALDLSMKAEALATTSRDMESSCKCLDTAIKSLALLGITKEEKDESGVGALEAYMQEQRAKAKRCKHNENAGSESETA
jgi:hypothetical protein